MSTSTDFTTVRDHPAVLLDTKSLQHAAENPGTRCSEDAAHLAMAADLLRAYETKHGVVFAALDRDALQAVQDAYEATEGSSLTSPWGPFVSAVTDLLGL